MFADLDRRMKEMAEAQSPTRADSGT